MLLCAVSVVSAASVAADPDGVEGTTYVGVTELVDALAEREIVLDQGGVKVSVNLRILFGYGSAQLLPESLPQIASLAEAMSSTELSGRRFLLIGHTDSVGSEGANLQLSRARAETVRDALVSRFDVDPARLAWDGRGESEPLAGKDPRHPSQRRVEVVLLPRDGEQTGPGTVATDPAARGIADTDTGGIRFDRW
jgi:outer membrane protein OmpA-like peptidoglycan-associated protein